MAEEETNVRVDAWIWSVRLTKTRALAAAACRGGHVRVNGDRVKPATSVRPGDEVRLREAGRERIVVVSRLVRKRVGATVAAECFVDNSPPPPPREESVLVGLRDRGAGRPTKRDRRDLERLYGRPGAAAARGEGRGEARAEGRGEARGDERGEARAEARGQGRPERKPGGGRSER